MEDLRKSRRLPDHTENGLKLGQDYPGNKRTHKYLNGQKKVPNFKHHAATEESTRYWPMTKITSWCWRSSETGERYCSFFAMHWERRQPRETSGSCDFNWCLWGTVRFRKYWSTWESEAATYGPHHWTKAIGDENTTSQSRRGWSME